MFPDILAFRWQDLLDIFLTAVLLYQILHFLRGTQGAQIIAGIVVLLLAYWGARRLELFTLEWLLGSFVKSLLLIVIILFQADIRRLLSRMGRRAFFRLGSTEPLILEEIAAAASELAHQKIGALMVLSPHPAIPEQVEGGIRMEALVSRELLMTLFWPGSPTHDGAAVIAGDQILAAGCVLPLSHNPGLDPALGTRHRAGLGVTEHSDAVAVIVSEERGQVSLAREGKLYTNLSRAQLLQTLHELLAADGNQQDGWLAKLAGIFKKK